jgi:hypothetical protein
MTDYVKFTNFTVKDSLPTGDTNKVIRGAEFDTEFDAIATAVATKSNIAGPTFTGTATFDGLTATGTVDFSGGNVTTNIDGGSIDGVTIGGSTPGAGTFSSLVATTADINAGTVDNTVIGGSTPAAGSFSTADIDGGTIDNTVIGGTTPAAVSGTTGTFSGVVSGTTGTFSGAVTGSNLNVSNWDTAFSWGNHSTEGYLTSVTFSNIDAGAITTSGETFADSDTQIPTNAAVRNWVLTTYPTIVELNDLTANVTWATVPDAYISASSVNQHVSVEKATQSKTYLANEISTITLSSSITSGAPVVSATKEVPQTGVSNNDWDVNSTTENYTRINSATATTLDFVGFDVSTAAFSQTFSISSQDSFPEGLAFNTNGTKMFVVGANNDNVYEYNLSTGFDVSTASYSQSFSVSSQDGAPRGVAFNSDGTKMFIVGYLGQDVNEYTLSTGFDVSTASYSQNFSVATEETTPRGIAFNTDGTKMFIIGQTGDDVNEYTLSTGFDVSTASYSQNFSVASQDTSPITISFNANGTKMFLLGDANDTVYEYDLSTGFDVSTASYSQSFSVTAQETNPRGLAFNTDGTKMFVLGNTGDDVTEYDLTPAQVTLGTGSFASADVGKTIEANSGVFVLTATDGSISTTTAPTSYDQVASGSWEMYAVVYNATNDDLELSGKETGYDISTASEVQYASVNSQDQLPVGLFFNTDGTKMYMLGQTNDYVYEYTLSTAFDVSTLTSSTSFYIGSQESQPQGLAFNNNGSKMFVAGYTGDDVNEYTLSTPFTVSTAAYSQNYSVSAQTGVLSDVRFNNDGTKMYILSQNPSKVFQYTLTTGFNVSTANYDSKEFSLSNQHSNAYGLAFNKNGSKMFVCDTTDGGTISSYNLSTNFDITTATFEQTISVASDNSPEALFFNSAGTKLMVLGNQWNRIIEYDVDPVKVPSGYNAVHTSVSTDSTYWIDINSMTADESAGDGKLYYAVSTDDRTTWKVANGTDGERSIVRNSSGTWQYNSNTTYGSETWVNATTNTELSALEESMSSAAFTGSPFSIGEASYASKSFSIASQETIPRDVKFNTDGTKMFVVGNGTNTVYEYDLTTGFDVSTASYSSTSFSVSSQETATLALAFNNDGTKMYISGNGGTVYQYGLTTGFDLSTASYSSVSFAVTSQDLYPAGITFNADGTKMFILGQQNDTAYEYNLSSAFVVSSATYSQSFSVAGQALGPAGIVFNADGTVMIILDITTDKVYEYTLSTGFDLSTASYADSSFSVNAQDPIPLGLAFNDDGFKMYIAGSSNDTIYQYDTGLADSQNRMDKTQLDAVADASHFTLGNDLDLAIIFNWSSGTTVPSSDGVSINYDANTVFQGAVLGTDYNWDFPAADKVRITSLAAQNLKVRII